MTLISQYGWVFVKILAEHQAASVAGARSSCIPGSRLQPWHLLPTCSPPQLQPVSPKPLCTTFSAPCTVLLCLELSSPHPLPSQHLLNACLGPDTDGSTLQGLMPLIITVCCAVGAAGSRPIHPPALSSLEHLSPFLTSPQQPLPPAILCPLHCTGTLASHPCVPSEDRYLSHLCVPSTQIWHRKHASDLWKKEQSQHVEAKSVDLTPRLTGFISHFCCLPAV